jgi:cytoskeletal protein RodZ
VAALKVETGLIRFFLLLLLLAVVGVAAILVRQLIQAATEALGEEVFQQPQREQERQTKVSLAE